jgi:hypothetical protein
MRKLSHWRRLCVSLNAEGSRMTYIVIGEIIAANGAAGH